MERKYLNAFVGAPTAFATAGTFVFTWYERGSQVIDVFTLVNSPGVNWAGWYTLAAFTGAAVLIAINVDLAQTAYRGWRQSRQRHRNTPIHDALSYIVIQSAYGVALPKNIAAEESINAFCHAARAGKFRVMGRRPDSPVLELIKPSDWVGATIARDSITSRDKGGRLICLNEEKAVRFWGLLVDLSDIERLWPKDGYRGPHGWMAG